MKNFNEENLQQVDGLDLFHPHRVDFKCQNEASSLLHQDVQADDIFHNARALEDPSIYVDDRDFKKIVRLTRQAADRRHWMAMLNLASMYLERLDLPHGDEDALKLVQEAVRLGVPTAYDLMGTYYSNGTAVGVDATKAYAYWQKAAELGSPSALLHLAEKLNVGEDSENSGRWSNIPVATKMLECALSQGHGAAADSLHYLYAAPRSETGEITGPRNSATKAKALRVLHLGVRLGCAECAVALAVEFRNPLDLSRMIVPMIDKARGERYSMLARALEFNPSRRFPNLDRILPLPPAELPPWDGKRESLLQAAMGITPPPAVAVPSSASVLTGRYFLAAEYALRKSGTTTHEPNAPFEGYWQPAAPDQPAQIASQLALVPPGLYIKGESFVIPYVKGADGVPRSATSVTWEHWLTVRHNEGAVEPRARAGLTNVLPRPLPLRSATPDKVCPATGVWQPWLPASHPLQSVVNQFWRQAWVKKGEPFPDPRSDWLLDLSAHELTWHLMDEAAPSSK